MKTVFHLLDDEDQFVDFISTRASTSVPAELSHFFEIKNLISEDRVRLAYSQYKSEIARFSEYLNSKNPDQYKRSGALLMALCRNPIINSISGFPTDEAIEEIEGGFTQFNWDDSQHIAKFLKFYGQYHDQFLAFDLSFRACASFSPQVKSLDFNLIWNICHYLKKNNLSSDSYFMLFRLLMA